MCVGRPRSGVAAPRFTAGQDVRELATGEVRHADDLGVSNVSPRAILSANVPFVLPDSGARSHGGERDLAVPARDAKIGNDDIPLGACPDHERLDLEPRLHGWTLSSRDGEDKQWDVE